MSKLNGGYVETYFDSCRTPKKTINQEVTFLDPTNRSQDFTPCIYKFLQNILINDK